MEATGQEDTLAVGRFVFSKAGFNQAIQIIRDANTKEGWLVIDEIGPLEINGQGFCDVLKEVLSVRREKILLVVREGMIDRVKETFALPHVICISSVSDI